MLKKDAVSHYGSQEKVALALNIRRQAVQAWGKVVPLGRAYQLQVLSRGRLRVDPLLYPEPTAQAHA